MTEIYLIRHGQASFGTDDYDKLSPRGEYQCELLGKHFAAQRLEFAASYSGPLRRQRQSAAICCQQGGSPGEVPVMEEFREYDAKEIFNAYLPQIAEIHPELAVAGGTIQDRQLFQRALMAVTASWIADAPCDQPIERFAEFRERVVTAIEQLLERHGSRDSVAVHTSGGVIAVGVGIALGLDPERTIALNWQVVNSAVTRIRYGRTGYMLVGFNSVPHLEKEYDPALITFR